MIYIDGVKYTDSDNDHVRSAVIDYLENWNGQLVLKESFESFVLGCGES